MPNCFVKGCKNTSKNGTRLFVFPRDEKRRQIWSAKCGRNSTPHSRICEYHFEESQFEKSLPGEWRRLKPKAIPTIFNKNDLTSDSEINVKTDEDTLFDDARCPRLSNESWNKNNETEENPILPKHKKLKADETNAVIKTKTPKYNFENMCRTCSCEGNLRSLFDQDPIRIADMLIEIADLKIMEGDPFPQKICTFCVDKLKDAYNFIKQCQNIRIKLEEYLNNSMMDNDNTLWTEVQSEIKQETNLITANAVEDDDPYQDSDQDHDPDWNDATKYSENSDIENEQSTKKKKKRLKMHECPHCHKKTSSLKDHLRTHTKPYKCDICGMKFSRRSNCARHKKVHANDALKKTKNDGEEKVKKKYKRRFHECPICTRKTQHLKVHMRSHTKEKPYKCDLCGKQFASRSNYSRHVKIHLNERPHVCEVCNRAFTIKHSLISHMKTHSTETSFKCELCEESFKHLSQLKQHTSDAHQDNEQFKEILASIDPQRNFLCDLCGKSYLRRYEFEGHLRAHTGEKPFSCTVCGKTFSTSPLLYLHRKTHNDEKPFKCSYCEKYFRTRQLCKRHEFIHTGEKPLKCDLCGKSFRKSSHLIRHKRTHTGEKPFGCNFCDKHFIVRDRLNAHIRIQHTGETPYTCGVCNEKFADLKILRRHEKKLHSNVTNTINTTELPLPSIVESTATLHQQQHQQQEEQEQMQQLQHVQVQGQVQDSQTQFLFC